MRLDARRNGQGATKMKLQFSKHRLPSTLGISHCVQLSQRVAFIGCTALPEQLMPPGRLDTWAGVVDRGAPNREAQHLRERLQAADPLQLVVLREPHRDLVFDF